MQQQRARQYSGTAACAHGTHTKHAGARIKRQAGNTHKTRTGESVACAEHLLLAGARQRRDLHVLQLLVLLLGVLARRIEHAGRRQVRRVHDLYGDTANRASAMAIRVSEQQSWVFSSKHSAAARHSHQRANAIAARRD